MRIWLVVAVLVSVSLGYGEPFKAVPVKGAVTIDGSLADWWASGPEPVWMGRAEQVKKSEWGGLRDAGGAAFFLYDSKSLYFGAVVYDDRHLQTRVRDSFWLGDSVQVALDVLGNATVPGYRDENREIGFALTPEGPKCECTYMGRLMSAADAASIWATRTLRASAEQNSTSTSGLMAGGADSRTAPSAFRLRGSAQ